MDEKWPVASAVRQPKAAAIAGLAFGLILASVLVLLNSAAPSSLVESGTWIAEGERRDAVSTALALIPFGGIAFLWFIAVVRSSLGRREDRFFDAVFMGSGLMFVAMLFAAAAVLMSTLSLTEAGVPPNLASPVQAWALASALLGSFGARMAAVFALAVSTAGRHLGSLPRWLILVGYITGALLLLTPPLPRWAQLLFPFWVMAISVQVLVREHRQGKAAEAV
ncbi:MAG TPA: hypothetical protein VES02_06315 [Dermatophilaceae bacterium]|nr:hypothetical protein [Dermatophilaceae bacterium]